VDTFRHESSRFNMAAIIDIVFLLIIFFMLVCQFIAAENFQVAVPDDIDSADHSELSAEQTTTVTVMFDKAGGVSYAVGAEKIDDSGTAGICSAISEAIDKQLQNLPIERRVVCLRIDKDICYSYSQYALAGIDQSSATDIKLAVMKEKQIR